MGMFNTRHSWKFHKLGTSNSIERLELNYTEHLLFGAGKSRDILNCTHGTSW